MTRVEVTVRTGDFNLPICKSAQACCKRRKFSAQHTCITDENHISLQQLLVLFEESIEAWRANLLLALKNEFHIMLQKAVLNDILESLRLNHCLSLVIIGTARPHATILNDKFKRIGVPQLKRLNRHNVIVRIYKHCRRSRVDKFLGIHKRITGRRHNLCFVHTGFKKQLFPTLSTSRDISLVFSLRTDTRNSYQRLQLLEETLLILLNIFLYFHNYIDYILNNAKITKIP